ncbi:MerR family transcriptional regulator [Bacteroides sp.]|uniref:MerR family transcriptional regulator n=1 Tax=Bacteroides sp. TaxID=29523 RepID=UPI0026104920|nr:MerR family transcriptional regulator [Bacteroides sp.]MDD3040836.1 MerR family transcriptional regulator [Bacteroides sp.]
MTKDEVSRRYQIPITILDEYQSWGLCGAVKVAMADWQYDEQDLERLSMIMALHDIGFDTIAVEEYMKLLLEGEKTQGARLSMLNKQRGKTLEEIHLKERQLERLDYLRHVMREGTIKPE